MVQDTFYHCVKRRIDGVKALSGKAGGRRLSRPNEIAVPEPRYVSDVITRWRRHPPEIGINIVLPDMNLFHQVLRWQAVRLCSDWSEIMKAAARTNTLRILLTRHSLDEPWNGVDNNKGFHLKQMVALTL